MPETRETWIDFGSISPRRSRGSATTFVFRPPGPFGPGYTPRPAARPDPAADGRRCGEFHLPGDDSATGALTDESTVKDRFDARRGGEFHLPGDDSAPGR